MEPKDRDKRAEDQDIKEAGDRLAEKFDMAESEADDVADIVLGELDAEEEEE